MRRQRIGWQYPGVTAQPGGHEELPYIGGHGVGHGSPLLQNLAFRGIADTSDRKLLTHQPEFTHGHLILGEGASLIRANDRGTSQSFDGRQTLHQSMTTRDVLS